MTSAIPQQAPMSGGGSCKGTPLTHSPAPKTRYIKNRRKAGPHEMACWPNGKASDYESGDCRFDPCVGQINPISFLPNISIHSSIHPYQSICPSMSIKSRSLLFHPIPSHPIPSHPSRLNNILFIIVYQPHLPIPSHRPQSKQASAFIFFPFW